MSFNQGSVAEDLLRLRKRWKRTSHTQQASETHLDFLLECAKADVVPKGLRPRTRCVALAAARTNIRSKFQEIADRAAKEMRSALIEHYTEVVEVAIEELQNTTDEITTKQLEAPPHVLTKHQNLLKLTKNNIKRRITLRRRTTSTKLDRLIMEIHNTRRIRIDTRNTEPSSQETSQATQPSQQLTSASRESSSLVDVESISQEPEVAHDSLASTVTNTSITTEQDGTVEETQPRTIATKTPTLMETSLAKSSSSSSSHKRKPSQPVRFAHPVCTEIVESPVPVLQTPDTQVTSSLPVPPGLPSTSTGIKPLRVVVTPVELPLTRSQPPLPKRILKRDAGTDPRDPTFFPLAKQKTLLCYRKRSNNTPPGTTSPSTHPAPNPNLPSNEASTQTEDQDFQH